MNFNTEIVHSSWLQTIVWCLTIMPFYVGGMLWFVATVESTIAMVSHIHGISDDSPWTVKKILYSTILIPIEVLLLEAIGLIAVIMAFDEVVSHKGR